ncbi:carbohydrate-binding protein [Microbacterium mangrovi]|uniref:Carbohydrate-binding protein n=1 Tax=Microbacterium mangrovi TaxID=1348253 RepID=A0A0B2A653_9MICO|nr:extracellular solute-binding protein [Microbacterium mangrovi]KHK97087.1 carbohydrate-binding protein [Microbacterium mangrovi]
MTGRRTTALRAIAVGAVLTLGGALLAGCSPDGRETIRFAFSKREAIGFMTDLVHKYNASQNKVTVVLDTSNTFAAGFVRGNPPDIALNNYNMETARFVQRCALSDLSGTAAAKEVKPSLTPFMDQYGRCAGRTSALPYSVMASGVIYNKQLFQKYGVTVPRTWDQLLAACKTFQAAGVTPIYATFADPWTVGQGWYDYSVGGMLDTVAFFKALNAEGVDVGPTSAVSFQKDQAAPVDKMIRLAAYVNKDAASRAYGDGNTAMAEGKAAMYLQGPWAFGEIAKAAPKLALGTFPLPVTNDPADLKVRINMDLAAWIPEASPHKDAARAFLAYLYQPKVINAYNASQLGFDPTIGAAPPTDPRILGLKPYVDDDKVYQGSSVLVPQAIPIFNYTQAMILGSAPDQVLRTIDADFARLAFRQ